VAAIAPDILTIAGVATPVWRVGQGPPVLVANGGPGFSHRYMRRLAEPLAADRAVVFYDQPGCGESRVARTADAALTYRHLAELVDTLFPAGDLGFIAHSWGVLVALGARAHGMRREAFSDGLLVTPVPVVRARYEEAAQNLFARIPAETRERYLTLAEEGRAEAVVDLLLPYYLTKPLPVASMGIEVDMATFGAVTASLGDFDFRAHLSLFSRCTALTTGGDFSSRDLVDDLLAAVAHRHHLPDVGHFPFHEAPHETAAILRRVFTPDRS
jgi:pimeloyl-ACP methyl ester carboxylesterase